MTLAEIKKSYKTCLNLRLKKRKTIPYKDLENCLYVVETYIEWMEGI